MECLEGMHGDKLTRTDIRTGRLMDRHTERQLVEFRPAVPLAQPAELKKAVE